MIRIATAGWEIPKEWQEELPEGETHQHTAAGEATGDALALKERLGRERLGRDG